MSSFIEIDGKKFLKVTEAAKQVGYSRDHVSKLARDKKIVAVQVARQWYVQERSLRDYLKKSEIEQKLRQQKLSAERIQERKTVEQKKKLEQKRAKKQNASKFTYQLVATLVLCFGISLGFLFASFMDENASLSFSGTPLAGLLSAVDQKFPVAIDTKLEKTEPTVQFSEESVQLSTMENSDQGILLLGDDGKTAVENPTELFSDKVNVVYDEAGNPSVTRTNREGDVVEEIPFVVVPVNHEEMP